VQRILVLSVRLALLATIACGGDQTSPEAQVASVSFSPGKLTLGVGEQQPLTATARDGSGNPLSGRAMDWATSAPAVVAVSASGVVSGVGSGSATVTVTSEGRAGARR
jgi:uncharacterized protein YjdB